jgi:hypothetical protein
MPDELSQEPPARHLATYILELGTWRATCRVCGWTVSDHQRRQAAALFRMHIRASRETGAALPEEPRPASLPDRATNGTLFEVPSLPDPVP